MTPPSGRARAIQPHAYFTDVLTKLVS